MGHIPNILIAPCPVCQGTSGEPELRTKWRWCRVFARLECRCGVCGPWVVAQPERSASNVAGAGWNLMASRPGQFGTPPPDK